MRLLDQLARIAELEFAALVTGAQAIEPKRRFFLADGSFVDVWASVKLPGRFGFHWERRHLDGTVYRYDNFPDPAWQTVTTLPPRFLRSPLRHSAPSWSLLHRVCKREAGLRTVSLAAGRTPRVPIENRVPC
jgi:Family of unknown function (DUF6516)